MGDSESDGRESRGERMSWNLRRFIGDMERREEARVEKEKQETLQRVGKTLWQYGKAPVRLIIANSRYYNLIYSKDVYPSSQIMGMVRDEIKQQETFLREKRYVSQEIIEGADFKGYEINMRSSSSAYVMGPGVEYEGGEQEPFPFLPAVQNPFVVPTPPINPRRHALVVAWLQERVPLNGSEKITELYKEGLSHALLSRRVNYQSLWRGVEEEYVNPQTERIPPHVHWLILHVQTVCQEVAIENEQGDPFDAAKQIDLASALLSVEWGYKPRLEATVELLERTVKVVVGLGPTRAENTNLEQEWNDFSKIVGRHPSFSMHCQAAVSVLKALLNTAVGLRQWHYHRRLHEIKTKENKAYHISQAQEWFKEQYAVNESGAEMQMLLERLRGIAHEYIRTKNDKRAARAALVKNSADSKAPNLALVQGLVQRILLNPSYAHDDPILKMIAGNGVYTNQNDGHSMALYAEMLEKVGQAKENRGLVSLIIDIALENEVVVNKNVSNKKEKIDTIELLKKALLCSARNEGIYEALMTCFDFEGDGHLKFCKELSALAVQFIETGKEPKPEDCSPQFGQIISGIKEMLRHIKKTVDAFISVYGDHLRALMQRALMDEPPPPAAQAGPGKKKKK